MALFKDIEDISSVFPYLQSTSWEQVKPFVELVELEKLRDEILGPTLYDQLSAAYQASIAVSPTTMPGPLAALNARVRPALAFLAAYDAAPTLNVQHSSGGMMVGETQHQKPAHMWRVNQARTAMLKQAYGFLNQLVGYLVTNQGTHTTWNVAPVYTEIRESLVPTVAIAQRYTKLTGPWLLHHLRPAMRLVQEGPVRKVLGDTRYDALLAAVQAGSTTPEQNTYLKEARPAILFMAIAKEYVNRSISIDEDGVWNWASVSSGSAVSGGKQPIDKDRMNALVRNNENAANDHLEALRLLVTPDTPSPTPDRSGNTKLWFG